MNRTFMHGVAAALLAAGLCASEARAQATNFSTGSNFSSFGSSSSSSSSRFGSSSQSSNSRAFRTGGGTGSSSSFGGARGGVGTTTTFAGTGRKSTIDWSAVAPGETLYRWFDEEGNVHYGSYDQAPKDQILAGGPGEDVRKRLLEEFYGDEGPPAPVLHVVKDASAPREATPGEAPPGSASEERYHANEE